MKRTDVTYGNLETVLRALGFTCRAVSNAPPGRIYQHPKTGAIVMLPAFNESDRVYEHHLAAARWERDNFRIAEPTPFDATLRKAG